MKNDKNISFEKLSRKTFHPDKVTENAIQTGCLQRIAQSLENMVCQNNILVDKYAELQMLAVQLENQNKALKSANSRLKNKIARLNQSK